MPVGLWLTPEVRVLQPAWRVWLCAAASRAGPAAPAGAGCLVGRWALPLPLAPEACGTSYFFVCPHTRCHSRLPAHGFLRLGCDLCQHELLLAFSCKRRGFCPSCAGRRMAQTAAHLVEQVMPWVPTRQWVVSVPILLRYGMAAPRELTTKIYTIIRTTIEQYYVH
jgi:hypothetical protein